MFRPAVLGTNNCLAAVAEPQAARMALHLHHVFVCTSLGAPEAEGLLDAGLVEGSSNTHLGQGTANRRFFFESGFLELLWVHDEREARSALVAPTKLWERWAGRGKATNPFGLCFSSAEGADPVLPFPSWEYRPDYLPDDRCMFFAGDLPLSEPEVFVLSWPQVQSSPISEPKMHPLGLCKMKSVSIGLPDPTRISGSLRAMRDAKLVDVHLSAKPELFLEFSSQKEVRHSVPALGLTMLGRSGGFGSGS
jgi:hypothetical protein